MHKTSSKKTIYLYISWFYNRRACIYRSPVCVGVGYGWAQRDLSPRLASSPRRVTQARWSSCSRHFSKESGGAGAVEARDVDEQRAFVFERPALRNKLEGSRSGGAGERPLQQAPRVPTWAVSGHPDHHENFARYSFGSRCEGGHRHVMC